VLIEAVVEAEGFGWGGVVATVFGDVQVAGVFDSRGDGGADGGQAGGPAAGAGGGVFTECDVSDVVMCLDGPMPAGEPGQIRRELARQSPVGTVNDALNVPVDEVAAVASWVGGTEAHGHGLADTEPEPDTLTLVAGGPDVGFMMMLAVPATARAVSTPAVAGHGSSGCYGAKPDIYGSL
jgi:hypothetical protein